MGTEIEKKILCKVMDVPEGRYICIEQRYLLITPDWEVRIRRKNGVKCCVTVKHGRGLVRGEWEYLIPSGLYNFLAFFSPWGVCKKRYFSGPWEIDIYPQLSDLAVAEAELSSILEHVPPFPDWLLALSDITERDEWKNKNIAISGFPRRRKYRVKQG